MPSISLKYDPYAVFRASRTPCGLYARQKWLQEASSERWQKDFHETVGKLYRGLDEDRRGPNFPMDGIHRLFGLHLTVRDADPRIERALQRLIDSVIGPPPSAGREHLDSALFCGLPFSPSHWLDVVLPATLFLCAIFGKTADPTVMELYRRLRSSLAAKVVERQSAGRLNNALRALVVLPDAGEQPVVEDMVSWLAEQQTPSGEWGRDIPFFQTVNALAHIDTPASHSQCLPAFQIISSIQNVDGSWGKIEREWSTFLVVHALRNKELL